MYNKTLCRFTPLPPREYHSTCINAITPYVDSLHSTHSTQRISMYNKTLCRFTPLPPREYQCTIKPYVNSLHFHPENINVQ